MEAMRITVISWVEDICIGIQSSLGGQIEVHCYKRECLKTYLCVELLLGSWLDWIEYYIRERIEKLLP